MSQRRAEGVSEALYNWAKDFDSSLRLNASVEKNGDKALITSSGAVTQSFIDGTEERQINFALVLMAPWSEDSVELNSDALLEGEAWLDWVAEQYPTNVPDLGVSREVVDIDTDEEAPVQVEVFRDAQCAKYQFLAHMTYRS